MADSSLDTKPQFLNSAHNLPTCPTLILKYPASRFLFSDAITRRQTDFKSCTQASEAISAIAKAFETLSDSEKQAQMKKVCHRAGLWSSVPSLTSGPYR